MSHPRHSVAVTLSRMSGDRTYNLVHERKVVYRMFIYCPKFHQIIHDTTTSKRQPVLAKKDILSSWLIAWCKLTPNVAWQMWRHNYVIGRDECT